MSGYRLTVNIEPMPDDEILDALLDALWETADSILPEGFDHDIDGAKTEPIPQRPPDPGEPQSFSGRRPGKRR